ncbi:hypothetical protein [Azospirillum brasilense]|uniref:hypothetical protein n=1 Tax=Azospirillum brasilense TaxID=192 RepID=UPI00190B5F1A|nr:hypothetical protein [Azospirillum brasilense]
MTRRIATPPQSPSPLQPASRARPAPGFTVLPSADRRGPRREVAMLCETDSGHRWDGA